jgi:sugar transferase (PEP-CTERM/EpsH1 system associated)
MVRHLNKKHTVVVASLAHTDQELYEGSNLKEHCQEVIAEVLPNTVRWVQAARALASPRPSSVAYFWSRRLRRRIEDAAHKFCFDAVMVHCAFAAQYALDIPAKFRMLDYGDLDSGKWFDYQKFRGFPFCYGYGIEARKLRSYECGLAKKFDYCTLTTQGELEEFKKLNVPVPSSVIPNGVDFNYFQPAGDREKGQVIVFVGRMDYFPNIDGVEYFARKIFPIVRKHVSGAELRIVGTNPSHAVRDLTTLPGVTVTGHVPDVRPYLFDAAVAVAPLRLARGTQNKILESMAMGIPVVATAVAAKGVAAVPGEHLLVADAAEQFASEVIKVLENEALGKSLSEAAHRQVEKTHSWPRSMEIVDCIFGNVSEKNPNAHALQVDLNPGRVHSLG